MAERGGRRWLHGGLPAQGTNARWSIRTAVGVFAAGLLLVPLAGVAHADITGTNGDDRLRGNENSNTIYALAGNDTVAGFRAGDNLYGGDGNDTIRGGDGPDSVFGGNGRDTEFGGSGGDTMNGGDGNDTIYAGSGRDVVNGDEGDDEIFVKDREDYDGPGDVAGDEVHGGGGADAVYARDGERDRVACGAGADTAYLDFEDQLLDTDCERVLRDSPEAMQDSGKEIAQVARDWALLREDVAEQPLGSNRGPQIDQWQQRVGMLGVAWCGIFAHEAYFQAGSNLDDRVASTDWLYDAAIRGTGRFQDVRIRDIRPGDLLLLDFPGGDSDDHIAIVTQPYGGNGTISTISGNYSDRVMKDSFSTGEVALAVRVHL